MKNSFAGFKLHLLGDPVRGLILSATVTRGSEHDGMPAHRPICRAKELVVEQVLGDTAYGGSQKRSEIRERLGANLLTPPASDNGSTRANFAIGSRCRHHLLQRCRDE